MVPALILTLSTQTNSEYAQIPLLLSLESLELALRITKKKPPLEFASDMHELSV